MSKSRISGMMSLLLGASVLGHRTELLVPEEPIYDDEPPRKQRRTEDQKRKKKVRQQRKKSRGY